MAQCTENEINGVNDISSPMEIDQDELPVIQKKSEALPKPDLCSDHPNCFDDDASDDDSSDDDQMDFSHNNDHHCSTTADREDPDPSPVANDELLFKDCGGLDKQIKYNFLTVFISYCYKKLCVLKIKS